MANDGQTIDEDDEEEDVMGNLDLVDVRDDDDASLRERTLAPPLRRQARRINMVAVYFSLVDAMWRA